MSKENRRSSSVDLPQIYSATAASRSLVAAVPLFFLFAVCQVMLKQRAACLSDYHSAQSILDSARAKLLTAQSTAGKEGKIPALEAKVSAAEAEADSKKADLDRITAAVKAEFTRSQSEKAAAMKQIVSTFVRLQVDHSNKLMRVWNGVLQQVQNDEHVPHNSAQ